ncbi:MAG: tRNA (guanosine(37)-N1)-methyltransferase TrmD [Candidatus Omnitrophica bacterium]|nr:tRNA (guanosine(37)-N1)-methyltransferase TrmD [Candidatus Omnitrophota bacterium]
MLIDILTIFPEIFTPLEVSIIKRAKEKGLVKINIYNLRDFTHNKHKKVDDFAYGGGRGMVMKPEPIFEGIEYIKEKLKIKNEKLKIILLTPIGTLFSQKMAKELSQEKHLIFICGHYEGVDERVKTIVDQEISIGDYVLTGGELPAMVVIDAACRLIPGVLPKEAIEEDSFSAGVFDWPHYTRPRIFRGLKVPEVLLSGNHREIAKWRRKQAKERTRTLRPDLIKEVKNECS